MKKYLLFAVLTFSLALLVSPTGSASPPQDLPPADRTFLIPLIGTVAPSFTAESTNGPVNFPDGFGRKWKILFGHPQDFTPVCTSEIMDLAYLQSEFDKLNVSLVVVSTDPLETHVQWKNSMQKLNLNNRGLTTIKFPLVDDKSLAISKKYGMIHSASNTTRDVRGVFIISPDNIVKAVYFYPMNVGRSTDELLRMVTALQAVEPGDVMTPSNWKAGGDLLVPIPPNTTATSSAAIPEGYYSPAWYIWYKKAN